MRSLISLLQTYLLESSYGAASTMGGTTTGWLQPASTTNKFLRLMCAPITLKIPRTRYQNLRGGYIDSRGRYHQRICAIGGTSWNPSSLVRVLPCQKVTTTTASESHGSRSIGVNPTPSPSGLITRKAAARLRTSYDNSLRERMGGLSRTTGVISSGRWIRPRLLPHWWTRLTGRFTKLRG